MQYYENNDLGKVNMGIIVLVLKELGIFDSIV
jgi:hypothetical protein